MDILCHTKDCLIVRTDKDSDPADVITTYCMNGWTEVESMKDFIRPWDKSGPWIITFAKGRYLKELESIPINSDYIKKYGESDNY